MGLRPIELGANRNETNRDECIWIKANGAEVNRAKANRTESDRNDTLGGWIFRG